uniref:Inositol-1-monophosphatase n=1 Tax=Lygus hesperus TaxID=30085 RepID=A0A0A9Z208_LYGHE
MLPVSMNDNSCCPTHFANMHALFAVHAALCKLPIHSLRQINQVMVQCAFIAAGRAEAMFDAHVLSLACAAGMLLVTEAGGCVTLLPAGADNETKNNSDEHKETTNDNEECQDCGVHGCGQVRLDKSGVCITNNIDVNRELISLLRTHGYVT